MKKREDALTEATYTVDAPRMTATEVVSAAPPAPPAPVEVAPVENIPTRRLNNLELAQERCRKRKQS